MKLYVNIQKKYKEFSLDVAFKCEEGILGLLGASGSGKSMTLRCIAGIDTPDSGLIVLDDVVYFDSKKGINLSSQERQVGFLFQNYALFPHLTVYQNLGFALNIKNKSEKDKVINAYLEMVAMSDYSDRYPRQLSGGQQQRVAIARALAIQPRALLLDEPFSALDNHLRSQMEKHLLEVLKAYEGVAIFVSHNVEETYRIAEQLVIFSEGKVIADANRDSLFKNPPNVNSAQITGCKNISPTLKIGDHTVLATSWQFQIPLISEKNSKSTHVGIRAHHIKIRPNDLKKIEEISGNLSSPCWLSEKLEGAFNVTAYVKLSEDASLKEVLHVEMSKEAWVNLKQWPQPWLLTIDAEDLMWMHD